MSKPTSDRMLSREEQYEYNNKFPYRSIRCNSVYLPQLVKDKIEELDKIGKTCQNIEVRDGNVFEIETAGIIERFVVQTPAEYGGKKTRKRNRKQKNKKKHVRKTKRARKVKK
jgi:hypothetical protein